MKEDWGVRNVQNKARGIEEIFSLSSGFNLAIRRLSLINSSNEELQDEAMEKS